MDSLSHKVDPALRNVLGIWLQYLKVVVLVQLGSLAEIAWNPTLLAFLILVPQSSVSYFGEVFMKLMIDISSKIVS